MPLWIDTDEDTYDNNKVLKKYQQSITPFKESIFKTIKFHDKLNWPIPQYGIDRAKQLSLLTYVKN